MGLCSQQPPTQSEAVKSEMEGRKRSDMQSQQPAKNFGTLAENLESALLKTRTAIEREHQSRHQQRTKCQAAVRGLVTGEIARHETAGQRNSLREGKSQTLAGNRIDRAGSVSDQRHITSPHAPQFATSGQCAPFGRGCLSATKARMEFRKFRQRFFQAKATLQGPMVSRGDSDTHFLVAHRSGVALTVPSPIYFHAVGPGRDAIVAQKRVAAFRSRLTIKIRPPAYARVRAIGSYDPPRANGAIPELDFLAGNSRDHGLPKQIDSHPSSAFGHDAMQSGPANGKSTVTRRKGR